MAELDLRGIIGAVRASWSCGHDEGLWNRLAVLMRHTTGHPVDIEYVNFIPLRTDPPAIAGCAAALEPNDGPIRMMLTVVSQPDDEPPPEALAAEQRIGGLAGLTKLLNETSGGVPPVVAYTIHFVLPANAWSCDLLPRDVTKDAPDASVLRLGSAAREHVGFRFQSAIAGIDELELTYLHASEEYAGIVRARGLLVVDAAPKIPTVYAAVTAVVGALFRAEVDHGTS